MLEERGVFVGIAVAVFATTSLFLVVAGIAAVARFRGGTIGRPWGRGLAFLGAVTLGTMWLVDPGSVIKVVPVLFLLGMAWRAWRRGLRTDAGLIVSGGALPWTILWGVYVWALVTGLNPFEPFDTWRGFLGGLVPVAIGLAIAATGDRAAPPSKVGPAGWQPGARTFGTIGAAIRGSNQIGPFGIQETAAVVALVVVQFGLMFPLMLARVSLFVVAAVGALAGAVAATEAYVRVVPTPSRKAFEAFSWLGEWEIARVREATGDAVPVTVKAADAWLARHPDEPGIRWIRAEVLLLAGRLEDGLAAARAIPDGTPLDAVGRASTIEQARWLAGVDTTLDDLEAAVEDVPAGGDDRLRAEVMLAAARTRRRMADGRTEAGDAAQPLIAVRERLGSRADGQVGRALRRRILPVFLGVALAFGLIEALLDAFGIVRLTP